jgi:sulfopyruvate decarboxylase TPP-binding subunit
MRLHDLPTVLGFDVAVGVPDSHLSALMTNVASSMPVYIAPREDIAVGVACGLTLGGSRPFVYMKNAGLLTCGDALLSLARDLGINVFLLVGWAGAGTDTLPHHVVTGRRTVPFLRALGISYRTVSLNTAVNASSMRRWQVRCDRAGQHRALLVRPASAT